MTWHGVCLMSLQWVASELEQSGGRLVKSSKIHAIPFPTDRTRTDQSPLCLGFSGRWFHDCGRRLGLLCFALLWVSPPKRLFCFALLCRVQRRRKGRDGMRLGITLDSGTLSYLPSALRRILRTISSGPTLPSLPACLSHRRPPAPTSIAASF